MITAKTLRGMLACIPDDAEIRAYEGEDVGMTVCLPDGSDLWIRATADDRDNIQDVGWVGIWDRRDVVTVALTRQAADCLAWWAGHQFYPDDLSSVIVAQMHEWAHREHKEFEDLMIGGDYDRYVTQLQP